jgi:cytochrome c oxidase subunit 2
MLGFLLLAVGGRPQENLSIFAPASPPAASIRYLFILVLAITAVIFLVVEGVLLYSLFRFPRKSGDMVEPPQVYGSKPIEIAWTAAPALIVFLLALIMARSENEIRVNQNEPPPGSEPLRVTVIGRQWWWEFIYEKYKDEGLGFHTANELHIPASDSAVPRPVYLTLKSGDVAHSFWVPRLGGKTDLIPGRTNYTWFQSDQKGLYLGQCAEFCGTQHANMLLRVYVDSPAYFDEWLANQRKPAESEPKNPGIREGRDAFLGQSCVNCHTVRDTSAKGRYAPDLTHLMSRDTLAAGMIPNEGHTLLQWVDNPQAIKVGCLMPAFKLAPTERDRIVSYLLSLK